MSLDNVLSSAENETAIFLPWRHSRRRAKRFGLGGQVADVVLRHFGRLGRQGEQREEVSPADGIRSQAGLESPKGILVLEQRDDDALRGGMLSLSEPRVAAPGGRTDCGRVLPKDVETVCLLPLLESEPGETQEHRHRHRPAFPKSLRGPAGLSPPVGSDAACSAGRTSVESRRSARSAAPRRSSSSSIPTATTRSSITSVRNATSAATKASRTGTSIRRARTTPASEARGDRPWARSSSACSG